MAQRLAGKVAVVTGGSSGIGLATAKCFVDEGADVFITGRRQSELDKAVGEIEHNITAVQGDVANLADLDRLYAEVKRQQGRVDVVFANAGASGHSPLGEITQELYDKIFNTNVKGLLFSVQKMLPLMPDGGSMILNASVSASRSYEAGSVYCASKAAVLALARGWAVDLKARKIRVNAVSPGHIETPMADRAPDELKRALMARVPLGRFGMPREVADAVLFLACDESSYVTGAEFIVDGGISHG